MTKEQLERIVGLIAGVELAIVHVCKTLQSQGVTPDLADSFRQTADSVPEGVRNRDHVTMVLRHIASGIESSQTTSAFSEDVKKLLN